MVWATRQQAKDWAAQQEYLVLNKEIIAAQAKLAELFDRYAREVSPQKRGARWEIIRLEKLKRDAIAAIRIGDLRPADLAGWRDRRLREVAPGSVIREMQLISSVLNLARREWGMIAVNPMSEVRRPKAPPPRDRLATPEEIARLAEFAGDDLRTATGRAYQAFLFSIETAMRAGEITGLTWDRIDLGRQVARLVDTKNGHPRDVPLSRRAVALLTALPEADPVFGLTPPRLDALWRKLRDRAGVENLTFHDARHSAITQLAKKLDVLDLARMVGHKDLRMLMVYYNESADALAKKLG